MFGRKLFFAHNYLALLETSVNEIQRIRWFFLRTGLTGLEIHAFVRVCTTVCAPFAVRWRWPALVSKCDLSVHTMIVQVYFIVTYTDQYEAHAGKMARCMQTTALNYNKYFVS